MSNEKFGVAIIGYGGMGSWHAHQLKTMDELTLCGVYDILPERNQAAERAGIHAYASREELLSDPAVKLVTVAIPNDLHHDVCIDCMKHGKNVISEKPVCLNHEELQDMIDASKENGVIFTVHQNRRWDEDFLTMKKIYDEGTLGRVFNIESRTSEWTSGRGKVSMVSSVRGAMVLVRPAAVTTGTASRFSQSDTITIFPLRSQS